MFCEKPFAEKCSWRHTLWTRWTGVDRRPRHLSGPNNGDHSTAKVICPQIGSVPRIDESLLRYEWVLRCCFRCYFNPHISFKQISWPTPNLQNHTKDNVFFCQLAAQSERTSKLDVQKEVQLLRVSDMKKSIANCILYYRRCLGPTNEKPWPSNHPPGAEQYDWPIKIHAMFNMT